MRWLRVFVLFGALASALTCRTAAVSERGAAVACSDLRTAREAVWAAWFAGDVGALRHLVSSDVVALEADGSWHGLDDVLAASRVFAKHGRLLSLEFSRVVVHRTGNVAIVYSAYRTTIRYDGRPITMRGRATEEFSLRRSCWYNTGWHLDQAQASGSRPM